MFVLAESLDLQEMGQPSFGSISVVALKILCSDMYTNPFNYKLLM